MEGGGGGGGGRKKLGRKPVTPMAALDDGDDFDFDMEEEEKPAKKAGAPGMGLAPLRSSRSRLACDSRVRGPVCRDSGQAEGAAQGESAAQAQGTAQGARLAAQRTAPARLARRTA